jgi:hypothetical protein
MQKFSLSQSLGVLANLGVIAGLVFVGLQLKQDRRIAESSLLFDGTNTRMYWVELVRESPDVWINGLAGESLTPAEAAQFEQIAISWELFHYTAYVTQPLLDIDPGKFVREWALQLYTHPGLMSWWENYRKRSRYTQPLPPNGRNPWFDAIDAEIKYLRENPPEIE